MKSPAEHATIQIELTSACVLRCSNCTRFCGTHNVPFFLEENEFKAAIDSVVEYAKQPHALVGFMGGEPLLHPQFRQFCEYAITKIPREKLGLWSTFPAGGKYPEYREIICKTFGNVLLNDHSRDDILHAPVLMASEEYFRKPCAKCDGKGKTYPAGPIWRLGETITEESETEAAKIRDVLAEPCDVCHGTGQVTDEQNLFLATEHCWIQEQWSSAINPKGAWFCEVAAALSDLFDGPYGWKVEPGWWKRTPMEFAEQRKWACTKCGAALPLERVRNSQDNRDDVSPGNLERLKAIKSRKVAKGEYAVREEFVFDRELVKKGTYPHQSYKDELYRKGIAARYGIYLVLNERGYWEPTLTPPATMPVQAAPPLYQIMKDRYSGEVAG